MINTLKVKILATIIHLFVLDISKTTERDPRELCDAAPRLEIVSESVVSGAESTLCSTKKDNMCWRESIDKLAFSMTVMAWKESKFLKRIHASKCWTNECDPVFKRDRHGRKYLAYHRARTLWQLHKTIYISSRDWKEMVGTNLPATTVAATNASRAFSWAKNRCKTDRGAFSLYATGRTCNWSGADDRVFVTNRYLEFSKNDKWVKAAMGNLRKC